MERGGRSALHHRSQGSGSLRRFIALLLNDAPRQHGIYAAAWYLIAQPAESPYRVIFPSHPSMLADTASATQTLAVAINCLPYCWCDYFLGSEPIPLVLFPRCCDNFSCRIGVYFLVAGYEKASPRTASVNDIEWVSI